VPSSAGVEPSAPESPGRAAYRRPRQIGRCHREYAGSVGAHGKRAGTGSVLARWWPRVLVLDTLGPGGRDAVVAQRGEHGFVVGAEVAANADHDPVPVVEAKRGALTVAEPGGDGIVKVARADGGDGVVVWLVGRREQVIGVEADRLRCAAGSQRHRRVGCRRVGCRRVGLLVESYRAAPPPASVTDRPGEPVTAAVPNLSGSDAP
jgi:hypothetical protein